MVDFDICEIQGLSLVIIKDRIVNPFIKDFGKKYIKEIIGNNYGDYVVIINEYFSTRTKDHYLSQVAKQLKESEELKFVDEVKLYICKCCWGYGSKGSIYIHLRKHGIKESYSDHTFVTSGYIIPSIKGYSCLYRNNSELLSHDVMSSDVIDEDENGQDDESNQSNANNLDINGNGEDNQVLGNNINKNKQDNENNQTDNITADESNQINKNIPIGCIEIDKCKQVIEDNQMVVDEENKVNKTEQKKILKPVDEDKFLKYIDVNKYLGKNCTHKFLCYDNSVEIETAITGYMTKRRKYLDEKNTVFQKMSQGGFGKMKYDLDNEDLYCKFLPKFFYTFASIKPNSEISHALEYPSQYLIQKSIGDLINNYILVKDSSNTFITAVYLTLMKNEGELLPPITRAKYIDSISYLIKLGIADYLLESEIGTLSNWANRVYYMFELLRQLY